MPSNSIAHLLKDSCLLLQVISDSPVLDCEVLLLDALEKFPHGKSFSRTFLRTWPEYQLKADQLQLFQSNLEQRRNGKPIAYIIGSKEFWSLELQVNDSTLIPRPDTETLVESALKHIPEQADWNILDLGTGSGAIALAIASERKNCQVIAMDYSYAALLTARNNARRLKVSNVHFYCGSWLSAMPEHYFNLIVSNPPYIKASDPHLQQGDLPYEPLSALASGEDGLKDIRIILQTARQHLLPDARIFIEHGYDQAEAMQDLYSKYHYKDCQQDCDLGGIIRVTSGQL